jgi:uncharacterized protein YuzE
VDHAMKTIDEKIQSARWLYDEEADVLYVSANDSESAQSVDVEDGILVRCDKNTKEIKGVTIIGLRARLQKVLKERD